MKQTPPKRRVLTAREKLMRKRYTLLVMYPLNPPVWVLYLSVDFQSFSVGQFDNHKSAKWTRGMLAIALAKIEL